jgi:hypothetical protein
MTCAHRQELQRTLPGALAASFYDEAGMIGVGALPVGQSQIMGELRPTNEKAPEHCCCEA